MSKYVQIGRRLLEGREHFVVPTVMIAEGVLNGSNGPVLYPGEELQKSVGLWNGKPVVVYHPGLQTSGYAGQPDVFDQQRVGTVFNARFDRQGNRVIADLWIDVARVLNVDGRVYKAIQKAEVMEVSTGLYFDNGSGGGMFRGQSYVMTAVNHRPDHLAILPDQVGAYSVADGGGLCRNEAFRSDLMLSPPPNARRSTGTALVTF